MDVELGSAHDSVADVGVTSMSVGAAGTSDRSALLSAVASEVPPAPAAFTARTKKR